MPLKHRGYGAFISCDGRELETYKVKVESGSVILCYIQSEAGKEFRVHWVDSKPPSHLSVEIRMDGRRMGVLSHTKQSSKTSNGGFRVAIDAHCPYQFMPATNDIDDALPSAYSEELGSIEVRLRRVRDFISVPFTPKAPKEPASVPERNRKGHGSSHCVSLGKKKEVKAQSTILKPLLIDDRPYVVFRFLYRPREYLQSKGILRGSSPSRPFAAVSHSKSSSGRRRKRQPSSEAPPSPIDGSPVPDKRPRTVEHVASGDDDWMPAPTADEDENDSKEDVVEVHLSSKNNYALPGQSASGVRVKMEPSIKQEGPPSPIVESQHPPPESQGSRSLSPVAATPSSIASSGGPGRGRKRPLSTTVPSPKDNSSPLTSKRRRKASDEDVGVLASIAREDEDDSQESVVEIHLSSKDNYTIPGEHANDVRVKIEHPVKREASPYVKREPSPFTEGEQPLLVKRESSPDGLPPFVEPHYEEHVKLPLQSYDSEEKPAVNSDDDGEETLVEIHLSSKNQYQIFPSTSGRAMKREITEPPVKAELLE